MTLAIDTNGSGGVTGSATLTYAHTCSGSQRALLVGITSKGTGGVPTAVSGITYNGVAMTSVGGLASGYRRIDLYQLVAPAAGANNVVVTMAASVDYIIAGSVSFTGADQTTPCGTFASAGATTSTATVNVSAATGDIVMDVVFGDNCTVAGSAPGAGQTSQAEQTRGDVFGGSSTKAGAATVTMSWTLDGTTSWAIGGVAVKAGAAVVATPPSSGLLTLGVG